MNLTDRSDEWLLRAWAQQRDDAALGALVARHWARAFRVALRVVHDPHLAEDVAQETFARVAQQAHRFEPDRAFAPWLYALTLNQARNAVRSRVRRVRHEAVAGDLRPTTELPREPGSVDEYLRALPDDLREALALRYGEELTLDEVAAALGCPVGTASSRIRRGLEKLREGGVSLMALTAFLLQSGAVPAPPTGALIAARAAAGSARGALTNALAGAALLALAGVALAQLLGEPSAPADVAGGAPITSAQPASAGTSAPLRPEDDGPPPPAPPPDSAPAAAAPEQPAGPPAAPAQTPGDGGRHVARIVADEDGSPIDDARVAIHERARSVPGEPGVTLGDRPVVVARARPDGRVALDLEGVGFPARLVVTAPGRRPLIVPIDGPPGELRLVGNPPCVEGLVVERGSGAPVAGAVAVVEQQGVVVDAVTGPDGRFVVPDLAPGRAALSVELDEVVVARGSVDVGTDGPQRVEVQRGAVLVVAVTDARGAPAGFVLRISGGGGDSSRPGRGRLTLPMPPGSYRVVVEREGLSSAADAVHDVTLAAGERRELSVTIDPSRDACVEVLVRDGRGAPLEGAKVTLERVGRRREYTGPGIERRSGPDGRVRFEVPPGRYRLELEEGNVESEPFEVAAGERRSLELARRGDRRVAGRLLGPDGVPLPDAQVSLSARGSGLHVSTRTGRDGRFELRGLPDALPPDALVVAYGEHRRHSPAYVTLAQAGDLEALELRLEWKPEGAMAKVRVAVRAPSGRALPARGEVSFSGPGGFVGCTLDPSVEAVLELQRGMRGRLFVALPGFALHRGPEVVIDEDVRFVVELPATPGRTITGRVSGPDGAPVAGASVGFAGVTMLDGVDTDAEGRFRLPDAPHERFEVEVSADGFAQRTVELDATQTTLEVQLERAR